MIWVRRGAKRDARGASVQSTYSALPSPELTRCADRERSSIPGAPEPFIGTARHDVTEDKLAAEVRCLTCPTVRHGHRQRNSGRGAERSEPREGIIKR
jgi:hypothetical protein